MNRKINEEQVNDIVKMYLSGISCYEIAREFNVTHIPIRNALLKRGIELRHPTGIKSKFSNEDVIKKKKKGQSIGEIAKEAGVKERAIWNRLKKMGVVFPRGGKRKYNINEDFFNTWSYEMAYILGFIFTDGCLSKNKRSFSISQKEDYILVEIAKCLGMPKESIRTTRQNGRNYFHLTISSVKMCRSLCWHGLIPNKSLTVDFPNVQKRYIGAFLRGVIDGNGWVDKNSYRVVICTGSSSFAEGLNQVLQNLNFNARIRISRGLYTVTVSQKKNLRMLADLIYEKKGSLYLKRKYLIFNRTYS